MPSDAEKAQIILSCVFRCTNFMHGTLRGPFFGAYMKVAAMYKPMRTALETGYVHTGRVLVPAHVACIPGQGVVIGNLLSYQASQIASTPPTLLASRLPGCNCPRSTPPMPSLGERLQLMLVYTGRQSINALERQVRAGHAKIHLSPSSRL
jgi:hypothetical protein